MKHSRSVNSRFVSSTPPTRNLDAAAPLVEQDRSIDQLPFSLVMARGTPVDSLQPCGKLFVREWLPEVVVRPRVQPGDAVGHTIAGSEDQDRQTRTASAQTKRHLDPRDVRQAEVQDHGLHPDARADELERLLPTARDIHHVPIPLEHALKGPRQARVILDDKQSHRRGGWGSILKGL